ncbi:MAG: hypothetical protein KGY48_13525 [Wenzhouxiangellaceae bacterium]|nr:hypothetical protein [Wenzhouxiangellaceae bacterium]
MSATNTASDSQHDQGTRLAAAVERVIRPFIRMIVGRVSCGFLVQQIKRIYIEEARRWIEDNDPKGRVTKSKLAMLTGLDTRTISSIEEDQAASDNCSVVDLCPEAGVLHKWRSSSAFSDEQGNPKQLPILGKAIAFQALVGSVVGRNVTCQTVLERLVESGNVEIIDGDFVRMIDPYYQPIKASDATIIDSGSYSIGRLSTTVLKNLNSNKQQERLLQQDRLSRRIPADMEEELVEELRVLLEQQILQMEEVLDRYEADIPAEGQKTVGVGYFTFAN